METAQAIFGSKLSNEKFGWLRKSLNQHKKYSTVPHIKITPSKLIFEHNNNKTHTQQFQFQQQQTTTKRIQTISQNQNTKQQKTDNKKQQKKTHHKLQPKKFYLQTTSST